MNSPDFGAKIWEYDSVTETSPSKRTHTPQPHNSTNFQRQLQHIHVQFVTFPRLFSHFWQSVNSQHGDHSGYTKFWDDKLGLLIKHEHLLLRNVFSTVRNNCSLCSRPQRKSNERCELQETSRQRSACFPRRQGKPRSM